MSNQLQVGSFQLMKSLNRSVILNMIRRNGPISRAEIAEKTKLTPPTVSNIVKELLDTRLIVERDQGPSRGGRKPTMLELNSQRFYIIGVDAGPEKMRLVLTNLNAELIESAERTIPARVTKGEFLSMMIEMIAEMLELKNERSGELIGIGVGMHGMVDVEKGEALYAPMLNLRNIPIQQALEERFALPVRVENDARAFALGEKWFGSGTEGDSFVCVNVGRGIGAGIVVDGKLFHGEHYTAGEIGHMTIDVDGPRCSCGNYGCLQALAAGPAIAARAAREIGLGKKSILKEWVNGDLNRLSGQLVYEAAAENDALAVEVLAQTGAFLGIGIVNLIHLFNPKRIILGGGVAEAGDFLLQSVRHTVAERALTKEAKQTEITRTLLGAQATAIGAVSLQLADLFSSPTG